jgi:hypothetical protein
MADIDYFFLMVDYYGGDIIPVTAFAAFVLAIGLSQYKETRESHLSIAGLVFLFCSAGFLGLQFFEFILQIPPPYSPSFPAVDLGWIFLVYSFLCLTIWRLWSIGSNPRAKKVEEETNSGLAFRFVSYVVILSVLGFFTTSLRDDITSPNSPPFITLYPALVGSVILAVFGLLWWQLLMGKMERRWTHFFFIPPPPPPPPPKSNPIPSGVR